jgi:light-regulated signal transduction histidine kinase (bacteriophytochrome)
LDEDAQEFIYYAVDGAKRMQSLISDLLSYSRIKSRAKSMKNVDFQEIVERAKEHLKFMIEESEAEITYDELPTLKVDRGQMVQLIQNLINNSIKYNDNKPVIHISAEKQNSEWIFSVTDNGIGINAKYSERVFQIFQRLHTKREYSGTGIGLAICKKIIERHNGKIWVESEENNGATFYFSIPENTEK